MATKELIRVSIPTALFAPPGSLNRVTGSRGGLRYYEHGGTGAKLISVTTILGEAVRKEGLERWKDGMIRSGLKSHMGETIDDDLIKDVTGKARREGKKAADIGTTVHDAIDGYLKGNEEAIDVPDPLVPAIMGFMRWQDEHSRWKYLESETAVFFQGQTSYAGTIDALFEDEKKRLVLIDWKTSKTGKITKTGIYPEMYMQMSAYCRALTNMTGQAVSGQIIRMVNEEDDQGNKVFDGEIESALVNPELWLPGFDGACYVYEAIKRTVHDARS